MRKWPVESANCGNPDHENQGPETNHLSALTAAPSGDPGARADYVLADELSWFPFEAELSGLLS